MYNGSGGYNGNGNYTSIGGFRVKPIYLYIAGIIAVRLLVLLHEVLHAWTERRQASATTTG